MKISFTISLLLASIALISQNFERQIFDRADPFGYYLSIEPQSEDIRGVLVLLPGFGQPTERVLPETKLHNVAYANGLLTVVVAGGPKLYVDETVRGRLNKAMTHVMKTFGVRRDQFVIGGFSAGGTISLRYAGMCYENPQENAIAPRAVFSVDGPVDLFEIWNYFERELERDFSEAGTREAAFVSNLMREEIGSPEDNPTEYRRLTPFHADAKEAGNEQFLRGISVRTYHDIDVVWQLENRQRSLYESNALPASEMINRLRRAGNERAEFVPAARPGVRSNGTRHPHSWSIVEEVELVLWVLGCLE